MLSRWVRLCESDNLRLRLCVLGRELFPQEEIDQCAHGKSDGQDNRFVGNDCFQRGEAGAGAETKPCEERFIAYGEADAQGEKANEHTPELVKGIDLEMNFHVIQGVISIGFFGGSAQILPVTLG